MVLNKRFKNQTCLCCSDWSDWRAHPVRAVCLFCEQQAESMDRMYSHMEVHARTLSVSVSVSVSLV